ncbi:MAG TPA: O-antigen ligase family protein [Patescibacteria group bacterium]|nr:O-antigen ligase family protein [Patescibacteria group bacterium]
MKKEKLIRILFLISIFFQLIFYHLPGEIKLPLFVLCLFFLTLLLAQKSSLRLPKYFSIFFLFYLLAVFFSSLASPSSFTATLKLSEVLGIFLLVIVGINFFSKTNFFLQTLNVLIFLGSLATLDGIFEFTSRSKAAKILPLFEPFHWPNLAASFMVLIFPLTLVLFLKSGVKSYKKIFLFSSLFLLACAWILSQTYIVVFILIIIFLFLAYVWSTKNIPQSWRRQRKGAILLFLLLAVTLPNLLPSFSFRSIPDSIGLFQDSLFFQERADIWRFSAESIKNNLWQGIGPGNFGPVYRQNLIKPWVWADYASNEPLQTGVETGLFGFLTQLALFIYLAIVAIRKILSFVKEKEPLSLAVALSVLIFLILSFTNSSLRVFPLQIIFFLLVSFLMKDVSVWQIRKGSLSLIILPFVFLFFLFFLDSLNLRRGQRAFLERDYPQAEKILLAASQKPLFFLNPKSFYYLATLKLETEQPQEAIFFLERLRVIDPLNLEIDYQIAEINYSQYQLVEAEEILSQALKRNPFLPPKYYLGLYKAQFEQGKEQESLKALIEVKKNYPLETEVYQRGQYILSATNYLPALVESTNLLYQLTGDVEFLPLIPTTCR